MADEKVFFQQADIVISSARFIFGNKTFAVNNVTSVEVMKTKRSIGGGIFLMILATIILAVLVSLNGPGSGYLIPFLIFSGGLAIVIFKKVKFIIVLSTSGAQQQPYYSTNKEYIYQIAAAMNEAIVYNHQK